jgi:hypothetical protein
MPETVSFTWNGTTFHIQPELTTGAVLDAEYIIDVLREYEPPTPRYASRRVWFAEFIVSLVKTEGEPSDFNPQVLDAAADGIRAAYHAWLNAAGLLAAWRRVRRASPKKE